LLEKLVLFSGQNLVSTEHHHPSPNDADEIYLLAPIPPTEEEPPDHLHIHQDRDVAQPSL
jgi:hypothetical protein